VQQLQLATQPVAVARLPAVELQPAVAVLVELVAAVMTLCAKLL